MEHLVAIDRPEDLGQGEEAADLPPFDPLDLTRHAPDTHWVLIGNDGETVGRCSVWWRGTPSLPGHQVGLIGHYAARDARVGRQLLEHACEQLAARGCTVAVGPMDGSPWRRYRLITERGTEPIFFLEPDNPDEWPGHFLDSGFAPLARYRSALNTDLSRSDPRMAQVAERLAAQDIQIRTLNPGTFEDELRRIYAVALASFHSNFLYSPLSEDEFTAQYHLLRPHIRRELVLIAQREGDPIGFLFAIPDLFQAHRGEPIRTVILKTIAVLPNWAGAGLGGLLAARCHAIARDLGYTRAIHALMHETNPSGKISRHYARTVRRYTIFARRLRP